MSTDFIISLCLFILSVLAFASLVGYTVYCVIKMRKNEDFPIIPYIVIFVISTLISVASGISLIV